MLLIAAELAVRGRAWYRHGSASPVAGIYQADPILGRTLRPGTTLTGSGRQFSINRWGFRGPDFTREKPLNTLRIAVIGDSSSLGLEASSDDAVWVQCVVALLNSRGTRRFEAVNGALPGYTLGVSTLQLSNRIAAFDPDVVVAYQVTADIAAHSGRQFAGARKADRVRSRLSRFLQKHSLLLNLIRVNMTGFRAKQATDLRYGRLDDDGLADYGRKLRGLVRLSADNGWRLVLCTCPRAFGDEAAPSDQHTLAASALANNPSLSLAGLNDAYDRYNDLIRAVARETGTPLVDVDEAVPRRADFFVDAVHLNDAGHRMVAEAVAAELMKLRELCGGNDGI